MCMRAARTKLACILVGVDFVFAFGVILFDVVNFSCLATGVKTVQLGVPPDNSHLPTTIALPGGKFRHFLVGSWFVFRSFHFSFKFSGC